MSRHRSNHYRDDDSDDDDFDYGSLGMSPASFSPSTAQFMYKRGKGADLGSFLGGPQQSERKNKVEVEEEEDSWEPHPEEEDDHLGPFDMEPEAPSHKVLSLPPGLSLPPQLQLQNITNLQSQRQSQPKQCQQQTPKRQTEAQPKTQSQVQPTETTKISTSTSLNSGSSALSSSSSSSSLKSKVVKQMSAGKRKEIEEQLEEKKRKNKEGKEENKEEINLVVIGHVDAGKSTLMGHLLVLVGVVDSKVIHKYERESQRIGKASFSFAWVMDEHEEERARGITMDVGVNFFETKTKKITLLDAPGHRDFVPNMITGAAQADAGILVIDSRPGEFESGFGLDGQTKEHALLARSLGVNQLIVVVNKLDAVDWSQERFDSIVSKLSVFLVKQVGFRETTFSFLPCSGLQGENILTSKEPALRSWYTGPTLFEKIELLNPAPRLVDKPFRMCIHDVYKGQALGGVAVGGKIESGFVSVGDNLFIVPNNEVCIVKTIRVNEASVPFSVAGANVDIGLGGVENGLVGLSVGFFLCDPEFPIKCYDRFEVQLLTFQVAIPLTKGYQLTLHAQSLNEPVRISRLIALLDRATGEIKKKNPRCVGDGVAVQVELKSSRPIPLELFSEFKQLGRITLRDSAKTVAAGVITALKPNRPGKKKKKEKEKEKEKSKGLIR